MKIILALIFMTYSLVSNATTLYDHFYEKLGERDSLVFYTDYIVGEDNQRYPMDWEDQRCVLSVKRSHNSEDFLVTVTVEGRELDKLQRTPFYIEYTLSPENRYRSYNVQRSYQGVGQGVRAYFLNKFFFFPIEKSEIEMDLFWDGPGYGVNRYNAHIRYSEVSMPPLSLRLNYLSYYCKFEMLEED